MPKKKKRPARPRHLQPPPAAADEQLPLPPQNPAMAEEPQLQSHSDSQPGGDVPVDHPESGADTEEEPQESAATSSPPLLAAGKRLALLDPLDLSKHEELFRALGLWDLAHLELGREIRSDLLAFLIANYDPAGRCSYVNGVLISVSPTDLAEALGLPANKEKADPLESNDSLLELFKREESVAAIEDFMSRYLLFEDDMCILPPEVVEASRLVKEGMPHKVDWAELMWVLVEKELLEAPRSGDCRYASHLQCLSKYQQPGLFGKEGEPNAEPASVPERELSVDGSAAEEEDYVDDGGDIKMRSLEDFQGMGMEEQGQGLSLGLSGKQDIMDGLEDCKEGGEGQWIAEGKHEGFQHCLQRCNSNDVRGMEFENLCKGEQEGEDGERYVDDVSAKFPTLERLTSMDLRAMDSVHVSYSPQLNSLDPSDGGFLSMRTDDHKSMTLDSGLGGSLLFESNGKRHIGDIDDEEDDRHQFPQNNQQKRMRTCELWEHMPSKFDTCMEQVECSVRKVKMLYAEKEQACMNAHLQLQCLNGVLQEKDKIIQSIEKTRVEELQKWQQVVCQYERELNAMAQVMLGYKKALRETRRKFAEYREKCSQGLEPLYSDVGGAGGLVLTSREIERQCLEKEEEMRRTAIDLINDFGTGWLTKFDFHDERVTMLHRRLVQLDGEVKLLKEKFEESP